MPRCLLKRAAIAFVLFMLMAFALTAQEARADTTVSNGAGDDTAALQSAIDNATGGTLADPYIINLNAADCTNPYTLSEDGTTGRAIVFNGDEQHIVIQGDDTSKTCIKRASGVGTTSNNWFDWFKFSDGDTTNIQFHDLRIHGNNNGDGFLLEGDNPAGSGNNPYDSIFNFNPTDAGNTPSDVSTYIDGVTLDDVEMEYVFGVCWFSQHITNVNLNQVDCINPTKDGFTFGFGSWGGTITNSTASLTGDDALAFNSCWSGGENQPEDQCALTGDYYVYNFTGGVDQDTYNGAAFYSRGAHDVRVENSTFNRSAVGNPNSSNTLKGSVMIEWSGDDAPKFSHSRNVDVVGSTMNAGNIHHGVRIQDDSLYDINLGDGPSGSAIINYNATDYCGIKATPNSNEGQIFGESQINFNPDNSNKNLCYN